MIDKTMEPLKRWIRKGCRFALAALAAFILNFGLNIVGHEYLKLSVNIVYPVTLVAVTTCTFLFCRFFVYPKASEKNLYSQSIGFIGTSLLFRFFEYLLFLLLFNVVGLWYIWAIGIVQISGTIAKFFFYSFFIFGSRRPIARQGDSGNL